VDDRGSTLERGDKRQSGDYRQEMACVAQANQAKEACMRMKGKLGTARVTARKIYKPLSNDFSFVKVGVRGGTRDFVSDSLSIGPHFVTQLRLFATGGWSGSLLWLGTEFIVSGV
jgi:hypothetical protein